MIDDKLTFARLRSINVKRCETVYHPLNDWSPTDWATAFAGEAGEACNEVKKLRRLDHIAPGQEEIVERARQEAIRRIADELADTIIYADLLAARLGIDLAAAIRQKFNVVSARMNCRILL